MPGINHQNNFATNLTSDQIAGVTTTPLNSIPTADAPYYIALDATNINSHYDVVYVTSDSPTNINHAATTYAHTTTEEVRMVIPAVEMDNLNTPATGAQITTGTDNAKYVTSKALADAAVGKIGAAWENWIPTFVNFTKGSATITAKYVQLGKIVHAKLSIILAADSSMGTDFSFSLPVTSVSLAGTGSTIPIGNVLIFDSGSVVYTGMCVLASTTTAKIRVLNVAGTYGVTNAPSATVPMTWATNDEINICFTYEAV